MLFFDHRGAERSARAGLLSAAWLPLLGFAVLVAVRAATVDTLIGSYISCRGCLLGGLAHHDLALLALLAALLALDLLSPWRAIRVLLRLAGILLVLAYALDLALFVALSRRLRLADVMTYGHEFGAMADFVRALLRRPDIGAWIAVALLALLVMLGIGWRRRRSPRAAWAMLGVAAVCAALWLAPLNLTHYMYPAFVVNVLEVNLGNTAHKPYSPSFRQHLRATPPPESRQCLRNRASDRPDVILVAVESLSAYQSALLGGPLNATPKLDQLAQANHYFTHFLANGFSTSGGRIALYTGRPSLPVPAPVGTVPLSSFAFDSQTLPALARKAGYSSHYFTSGDLAFSGSGRWLKVLGFDSIEGAESPFYEGMHRWQFNAPADAALFDRILAWLDAREDPQPFLATLLTVSSHPPFVNPTTGKVDLPGTFRYVDTQLARFVAGLRARGFFHNGVLMITGDHRSMTPLSGYEFRHWGRRAFARIPMIVIGDVDMPAVVTETFAQTDLTSSFAWLAGLETCLDAGHGIFTRPQPIPPRYVVHAGGQASRPQVYIDGQRYTLVLDGDDTRWAGDKPARAAAILERINRQRIREAQLARRDDHQ